MEFFEVVRRRRSVRQFENRDVPEEAVRALLEAAVQAPTAGNMQPWEFIVVRDRQRVASLVSATYSGYLQAGGQPQRWIERAPVVIVACVNTRRSGARYGEHGRRLAAIDVAAAVENLLLAATGLGLGACWVAGFDAAAVSRALGLPPAVEPLALIPVGYPERTPPPPPRLALSDVVYSEVYGSNYAPGWEE